MSNLFYLLVGVFYHIYFTRYSECSTEGLFYFFSVEMSMDFLSILFHLRSLFCVVLLLLVSIRDIKTYKIPNKYILGIIGNWVLPYFLCLFLWKEGFTGAFEKMAAEPGRRFFQRFPDQPVENVLSAILISAMVLVLALIFDTLLKKKSLGGGDVKLVFAVSLYLGWDRSLYMLFFACVLGAVGYMLRNFIFSGKTIPFSVRYKLLTKGFSHSWDGKEADKNKAIPFGPAIALGTFLMLLFP